ncbi:response regulator [Erythrobacter litoralis]|uniref:response regulator n=1 Tax=Erythrobacter litoralis TaxID=39960 RepID=UPI00243548BC|nr:response regulator [Erythrobacter litoralis]
MKGTSTNCADPPTSVLVVEDDAVLALDIEEILREAGVNDVTLCSTTEESLVALREKTPDVLVLDVHLADSDDGWAVAELVRTLGPKGPRVIFSTGSPTDIPEDIAAIGIVLEKPYDKSVLLDAICQPETPGLLSRLRNVLR